MSSLSAVRPRQSTSTAFGNFGTSDCRSLLTESSHPRGTRQLKTMTLRACATDASRSSSCLAVKDPLFPRWTRTTAPMRFWAARPWRISVPSVSWRPTLASTHTSPAASRPRRASAAPSITESPTAVSLGGGVGTGAVVAAGSVAAGGGVAAGFGSAARAGVGAAGGGGAGPRGGARAGGAGGGGPPPPPRGAGGGGRGSAAGGGLGRGAGVAVVPPFPLGGVAGGALGRGPPLASVGGAVSTPAVVVGGAWPDASGVSVTARKEGGGGALAPTTAA